jgi:hypothetical protein
MKEIVKKLLNEHGMTKLLQALIDLTNGDENYIQELNKGFRSIKKIYDTRYENF